MIKSAIISCGGFGTRLQSVVKDLPKPLALINNRHFIFYILDQLERAKITKAVLTTHHLFYKFPEIVGHQYKNIEIKYCHETWPLGTGGSINQAMELLDDETFIAMNGDDWLDIDFNKFIKFYQNNNYLGIIATKFMDDASRYGTVNLEGTRIINFEEKKPNSSGQISTGIYILNKKLFHYGPIRMSFSIERDCFPVWTRHGLGAYTTKAKFIDIGTPESYKEAQTYIK